LKLLVRWTLPPLLLINGLNATFNSKLVGLRGREMKSPLLTADVWKSITSAAKKSRKPAYAAVAYFGQGASKLLPLPAHSRLVVDASEGVVKSGQTCPADLRQLQKRGVVIYSAPRLHAKVYVFDGFAFIGSANVSSRSAGTLIEAMLHITDRGTISAARKFVSSLCLHELSPNAIDRLQRIYRPPQCAKVARAAIVRSIEKSARHYRNSSWHS
jgi:hypothetical protein